jgi:DNA-binding transcriptional MerR regulator/methylmalonyl-CoA mutase cobalamin-binding subunit
MFPRIGCLCKIIGFSDKEHSVVTPNDIHTFNLKAVLFETGLKADTLRAWERRYGLPQPERSSGGHRLYSQRDIDIIKWLIDRQQEGMSISNAVDLWHSLRAEGRDPLHMAEFTAHEPGMASVSLPAGEVIDQLRQTWVAACMSFDEIGAEQVLTQAFALYPAEVVCLELLQKGLAEVGEGWYQGGTTVQQEHFTSELAMRRLEALIAATPPPTRPERILIGCPSEEEHTFSALLLTLFLKRGGFSVLYMGANVPLGRLEATLIATKPHLLIMPAQQLHTAATLLDAAQALQGQGVRIAYGGLVFNLLPELRRRIPGHFLGLSLDQVPYVVDKVLSSSTTPPEIEAASRTYQDALEHYRERRALIEAHMWENMDSLDVRRDYMVIANSNLARNIMAALTLGDMDFIGVDLDWVAGLLSNHSLPRALLQDYLGAYYQAARQHLDERGAPILAWLARVSGGAQAL